MSIIKSNYLSKSHIRLEIYNIRKEIDSFGMS